MAKAAGCHPAAPPHRRDVLCWPYGPKPCHALRGKEVDRSLLLGAWTLGLLGAYPQKRKGAGRFLALGRFGLGWCEKPLDQPVPNYERIGDQTQAQGCR